MKSRWLRGGEETCIRYDCSVILPYKIIPMWKLFPYLTNLISMIV